MVNIVSIPCINGLNKTEGCEKAPKKIFENLNNFYTNEQGKIIDKNLVSFREIDVNVSNLEESFEKIYRDALKTISDSKEEKTIFLGGDHSISYPLVRSFFDFNLSKEEAKESCLVVFDAHPDLMPFIDVDKNIIPTHEEWLRALIEKGGFDKNNILIVGLRNSDIKELNYLKENKIRYIGMDKLSFDLENTCDSIMEFSHGKELYVSIDIDAIDPSFAPGTGYCEPGGLTSREFLYLIKRINKMKNLRVLDIVEINPDKDTNNLTTNLGSKILGELI